MSRPKIIELEITTTPDAAMSDPALVALFEQGYTWNYTWSKTLEGEGRKRLFLMVVMVPPSATPIARQLDAVVGAVEGVEAQVGTVQARLVALESLTQRGWLGGLCLGVVVTTVLSVMAVHWW